MLLYANNFTFETPLFFLKFSDISKFMTVNIFIANTTKIPI